MFWFGLCCVSNKMCKHYSENKNFCYKFCYTCFNKYCGLCDGVFCDSCDINMCNECEIYYCKFCNDIICERCFVYIYEKGDSKCKCDFDIEKLCSEIDVLNLKK